ncbi:fumarylacetoacetate hydrolase family protein [Edaphobacter bradus]|uniref:fumarylacetoacetate hydrolase family protein n=1 Tax=Edaphobacter bradus TaxID=2259016 RepID=UPI0021E0681A|nr:fumarylacetoacetate hydrolase family protein [Edaphobacter bradus]
MKLITFTRKSTDKPTPGVLLPVQGSATHYDVVDLSGLGHPTVLSLIEAGPAALDAARAASATAPRVPLSDAQILAPIPRPPRVFGIGLNYQSHAAESKMAVQKVPTVFMKLSSAVVGPDVSIILPAVSTQPDYEAELAVVIGKPGYQISAASAMDHVLGYTIANDVSARDIQLATSQWTLGKSFPTFCPLGPSIVTADEVPDPHSLAISLTVNGELLQSANTRDLIFKIPALIEYISSTTPLEAGDIISTGTPEGVGLGRTPPRWLKPNEEVIVTIERLGQLRNTTVAE